MLYDIFCGIFDNTLVHMFTRWSTWNYLLFFSLLLSMPKMVWNLRKTQAFVITILSVWLWASTLYYRQFHTTIPPGSYSQIFIATENYGGNITSLMQAWDLLYILPVALAWFMVTDQLKTSSAGLKVYWVALGVTFVSSWMVSIARFGLKEAFRNQISTPVNPAQFTPMGLLIYDVIKLGTPVSEDEVARVENWMSQHRKMFPAPTPHQASRDKVILILVESLDSWVLTAQVEGQPVMPYLNNLSTDSTSLFAPKVVCQTKDGHSSDGQIILSSGILPQQTGSVALDNPGSIHSSFQKAFAERYNIEPYYFDGSPKRTWNKGTVIPALGFKNPLFQDDFTATASDSHTHKISDGKISDYIIQQLTETPAFSFDNPWLIEFVTISSHYDYLLPPNAKSTLQLNKEYPWQLENYLRIMRYVDESIGKLLKYLQSRKDSDRISVIVTGDHVAPGLKGCTASFKDEQPFIPFLVINSPVAGRFDKYMGQVDMYTTLVDLFIPGEAHRGMGVSILSPLHPGVAVGSDGKVYGTGNKETIKHLQDAFTVSDIILRYNLTGDE